MIFILRHEGTWSITCRTSGCIDKDVLSSCHERGTKKRIPSPQWRIEPQTFGFRGRGRAKKLTHFSTRVSSLALASRSPRARLALAWRTYRNDACRAHYLEYVYFSWMWCKSITSNLLAFPLVSWNFLMIPISDLDWKKRGFERRGSLPKTWLGLELRPLDLKSRFETTRRLLILIAELTFLIFFFF